MTNPNITLMRDSVLELWNAGDVDGFMRPFTDDAELQPQARYPDDGVVIRGKEDIRAFFKEIHRPVVLGRFDETGDKVVCSFSWTSPDGAPAVEADDSDWTFVYTFADGQIIRAQYFVERRQALLSAGLATP